jgi:hypothetical protein
MNIKFRDPSGNEVPVNDASDLKEIILNKGKDYWLYGSGDAGIYINKDDSSNSLVMVYSELKDGFHINFFSQNSDDDWDVLTQTNGSNEIIEINYGGNDHQVPDFTIVSREMCFEVVIEYINTAEKPKSGKWVNYWDIDWPLM